MLKMDGRQPTASERRWIYHSLLDDHDRAAHDNELDHEFGPVNGVAWTEHMWNSNANNRRWLWALRARLARATVARKTAVPPSSMKRVRRVPRDMETIEKPAAPDFTM